MKDNYEDSYDDTIYKKFDTLNDNANNTSETSSNSLDKYTN